MPLKTLRTIAFVLLSTLACGAMLGGGLAHAQTKFESVEVFLDEAVEEGHVAGGALYFIQGDKVLLQKAFGFADIQTHRPFEIQTPCVVASISKPLMGTVAYRIAEQGKLDLELPIDHYLPAFANCKLSNGKPLERAPTVREFFTHRSGTRRDDDQAGRPWFAEWTKGQPLSFVVERYARDFPFKAQPGTKYGYSGIGIDIAARVMEVAAGKPRNQLLVEELCVPLGMQDTFYVDNVRTQGYAMPTRYYIGSKSKKLFVSKHRAYPEPNTYSSSGGSIVSTVHDLAKWLVMIRDSGRHNGQQFLTPANVEAMLHSQGTKNTHCGLFVRERDEDGTVTRVGHTGSSGTNCWIDFDSDTIGVMLTQTRGKDIKRFRLELERLLQACVESGNLADPQP